MSADPGVKLRSMLMLGMWARERAALDRAVQAVPKDPADWTDTGITSSMWGFHIGEQLTDAIPGWIKDTGERPAVVVARLIREALLLGVEIGRHLERHEPPLNGGSPSNPPEATRTNAARSES